jgi:hypothetical protein
VNVTFCPKLEGLAEDPTPVLLGPAGGGLTCCVVLGGIPGHGPEGPTRKAMIV